MREVSPIPAHDPARVAGATATARRARPFARAALGQLAAACHLHLIVGCADIARAALARLVAAGLLAALSACVATAPTPVTTAPPTAAKPPSAESQRLAQYYATAQTRLLSRGLLRTDGGGPDTPFTARNLVDNFERVALFDEYTVRAGTFVRQQTPSRLRRWIRPIRMRVVFGASVPPEQRAADTRNVTAYAARISNLTGHSITMTEGPANFVVLFLNRDEAHAIGPELRSLVPRVGPTVLNEIRNSPRGTFCAAYALSERAASNAYTNAVILIKAEHPDLLRLSCIHEEIAQAMGLANDSPAARPSIFNDDEEFALLTRQDELMLRMLYDPRLTLGMTPDTARPVLEQIARELMGGES